MTRPVDINAKIERALANPYDALSIAALPVTGAATVNLGFLQLERRQRFWHRRLHETSYGGSCTLKTVRVRLDDREIAALAHRAQVAVDATIQADELDLELGFAYDPPCTTFRHLGNGRIEMEKPADGDHSTGGGTATWGPELIPSLLQVMQTPGEGQSVQLSEQFSLGWGRPVICGPFMLGVFDNNDSWGRLWTFGSNDAELLRLWLLDKLPAQAPMAA